MEEVAALVVGVSPGHGGTYRAHHGRGVTPVFLVAVPPQVLAVQVPHSANWALECGPVWDITVQTGMGEV